MASGEGPSSQSPGPPRTPVPAPRKSIKPKSGPTESGPMTTQRETKTDPSLERNQPAVEETPSSPFKERLKMFQTISQPEAMKVQMAPAPQARRLAPMAGPIPTGGANVGPKEANVNSTQQVVAVNTLEISSSSEDDDEDDDDDDEFDRQPSLPSKRSIPRFDSHGQEPNSTIAQLKSRLSPEAERLVQLLERLKMARYYPSRLEVTDVVKRFMTTSSSNVNDSAWLMLTSVLSLDYRGRQGVDQVESTSSDNVEDSDNEEENGKDMAESFFANWNQKDAEDSDRVHPNDLLSIAFLCASGNLRQSLAERLFKCKLSVPLLLCDPIGGNKQLFIWALRSLVCQFESPSSGVVEAALCSLPMRYVALVRVGRTDSVSKSKLANEVISLMSGIEHHAFYHRGLGGGSATQQPRGFFNGMMDVAWYLPSARHKAEPVGFLNLHGDALDHPTQVSVLEETCCVVAVVLDISCLKEAKVVDFIKCLTTGKKSMLQLIVTNTNNVGESEIKTIINHLGGAGCKITKDTIVPEFIKEQQGRSKVLLTKTISKHAKQGKASSLDEVTASVLALGITVDEQDAIYTKARKKATNLFVKVRQEESPDKAKQALLPLQGSSWKDWSELTKKEARLSLKEGDKSLEHQSADISGRKQLMRQNQAEMCLELPHLTRDFIDILAGYESVAERKIFLQWLKLLFDDLSMETLPLLHREHISKWQALQLVEPHDSPKAKELRVELVECERRLATSSLGLENLIREVGQVYEASLTSKELKAKYAHLPRLVAELFLSGHPVELMDGDVSHVPLVWIRAVLREVVELVGSKNIFVLSVLGIQSSGKSTLLNSMLGLQFAVSAGRCTRGVFMQLIPWPGEDDKYDYMLVVDAEGLRAPELGHADYNHDRELATLVVGIGDATIINNKGEIQAEMEEVLQIIVHAFLRLRAVNEDVNLQPSCMLVHQNVSAVDAREKMAQSQKKILENLNKMTIVAAKEENQPNIMTFSDVIKFDPSKHIWYFSDLWQGEPPMAPVSPGYSVKVQELRQAIVSDAIMRTVAPLNFATLSNRLSGLWNGILKENFVFSFRNTIEIQAYKGLDDFLKDLVFKLTTKSTKLLRTTENKIMSTDEDPHSRLEQITTSHLAELKRIYAKGEQILEEFFEQSPDRHILEKWRFESCKRIKLMEEEEAFLIKRRCNNWADQRNLQLKCRSEIADVKEEIFRQIKILIAQLKGKPCPEQERGERFESVWEKAVSAQREAWNQKAGTGSVNIRESVWKLIEARSSQKEADKYRIWKREKRMKAIPKYSDLKLFPIHLNLREDVKELIISKGGKKVNKFYEDAKQLLSGALEKIEEAMAGFEMRAFADSHVTAVVDVLDATFALLTGGRMDFRLRSQYKIRFTGALVETQLIPRLMEYHNDFQRSTNPEVLLRETYYDQMLNYFLSSLDNPATEEAAANVLCSYLEPKIRASVDIGIKDYFIKSSMESVHGRSSKERLVAEALADLVTTEDFEGLVFFQQDTEAYLHEHLIRDKSRYTQQLQELNATYERKMQATIKAVLKCLMTALKTDKSAWWLDQFQALVSDKILFVASDLNRDIMEGVVDHKAFYEAIRGKMKVVASENIESLLQGGVFEQLSKLLVGCTARCPFCGSMCKYMDDKHLSDHMCQQHYPQYDMAGNVQFCPTLIGSSLSFEHASSTVAYRSYRKVHPRWSIEADLSLSASMFWKWYVVKYAGQLNYYYYAIQKSSVPKFWSSITMEEAVASLTTDDQ